MIFLGSKLMLGQNNQYEDETHESEENCDRIFSVFYDIIPILQK